MIFLPLSSFFKIFLLFFVKGLMNLFYMFCRRKKYCILFNLKKYKKIWYTYYIDFGDTIIMHELIRAILLSAIKDKDKIFIKSKIAKILYKSIKK